MELKEAKQILTDNGYLVEDTAQEVWTNSLARSLKIRLKELGYKEHEDYQIESNEEDSWVVLSNINYRNGKTTLCFDIEFFDGIKGDMYSLKDCEKKTEETYEMENVGEIADKVVKIFKTRHPLFR